MADFTLLLVPPDVADLLSKSADQVPYMTVNRNADYLKLIGEECTVGVVPVLCDGMQPSFTTGLNERACKVVSVSCVLKDRDNPLPKPPHFGASVLADYRLYLDEKIGKLQHDFAVSRGHSKLLAQCLTAVDSVAVTGSDRDDIEDEMSTTEIRTDRLRCRLRCYHRELQNVLELEKTSDSGSAVRS